MSTTPGTLLQRVRVFGTWFFHRFGIHCATHQTRLILISSIVISCLLFPAVALYSSTQTTTFSLSFLDALLTPDDISTYFALEDLRNLWDGYETLHTREDSTARARCGKEGILRVERVIVHDGFQRDVDTEDSPATLIRKILQSTFKFERRLSEMLASLGVPCVPSPLKGCLVFSPLAFWDYNEAALTADPDPLNTFNTARNTSVHGFSLASDMVLAGREDGHFDRSMPLYPVLTYYFPDADCVANGGHNFWLNVIEEAASSTKAEVIFVSKTPRLVALEYEKTTSTSSRLSVLSVFTYTAYLIFLIYFSRLMRRMNKVHSRIGLAFTGIVEIVVSTVTSLSVCALAGFRITMVPWEIFPIVVIFIGVENMFSIVDAVVKTSISLPVKERIAEGLGRAGTSNTLKLCSYNAVLGVIAFFSSGAIRQFCAFAIVVLVAHWFLVHTFFVTVLSIDIQRLELDDLLRQDASLAPSLAPPTAASEVVKPRTKVGKLFASMQQLLRGRPSKNVSLVLLLAVTATLYYMTQPHGAARLGPTRLLSHSRLAHPAKPTNHGSAPPALQVWHTLNPANFDLVHLRVESPTIVVVNPRDEPGSDPQHDRQRMLEYEKSHRSRWSRLWTRTSKPLSRAFNIVVVPTFVTTSLLYGLLLYLLKDAELLEAQRNRVERDSPGHSEALPAVEDPVSFSTLPRAFATDVDLLAASADGKVIATVGLQNEFVLWRKETRAYSAIDTNELLLGTSGSSGSQSPSSVLTAVASNDGGTYIAAGTNTGLIALWSVSPNRVQALPYLNADTFSPVSCVHFATGAANITGRAAPRRTTASSVTANGEALGDTGYLYATYENGTVIRWNVNPSAPPTNIKPSRSSPVTKAMLLPVQASGKLLVGFSLDDGGLELRDADSLDGLLPQEACILAGNPSDLVDKVHVCSVELEGTLRVVVGAATQAGVISLWDAVTGERMCILDEPFGPISSLRLMPVPLKRCASCGQLPPESLSLCFSFGQVVLFYRAYLSLPTRRCSCPLNRSKVIASVGARRMRSGSAASAGPSSGTSSPVLMRSRMSSFSTASAIDSTGMFPVSGHGSHSRRASDKRNLDTYIPAEADEHENRPPIGPQDPSCGSPFLGSGTKRSSLWENLVVDCVADATIERGSWDVANNKIVGIRRRPRIATSNGSSGAHTQPVGRSSSSRISDTTNGLTVATMERWEFWTFDPSESRLYASPLLALDVGARKSDQDKPKTQDVTRRPAPPRSSSASVIPRLHFTRVSPLFSSRSFCVAGFGNTVGLFSFGGSTTRSQPIEHLRRSSS